MKGAIKFPAVNIIITCNDHNPSQLSDGDRGGGKRNKNDGCEYLYFSALVSTTINYCRISLLFDYNRGILNCSWLVLGFILIRIKFSVETRPLLKSWLNLIFSDIALMQRFKCGTVGCKYNKNIYLSYIPKHPF